MNETITCVILEDDPHAATLLEHYVTKVGGLMVVARFDNGLESQRYLLENDVTLLLADIELPDMNAYELLESLPDKPHVILCTGQNNVRYATNGYRLSAVDYLIKPLIYSQFSEAIDKLKEKIGLQANNKAKLTGHITLRREGGLIRVFLADIVYVESLKNYVNIHFLGGDWLNVRYTLKEIVDMLPAQHFVRIHKSYCVSLRMVRSFTRQEVIVRNSKKALPFGRTFRTVLKARFEES